MNCPNCGLELKEDEKVCPICQTSSDSTTERLVNTRYEEYKENEQLDEKYGVNKLLIFSILELVCCSQLFGLIAVLFLFMKLKPAISTKNFEEAEKWKNIIRGVLIVGILMGIVATGLQVVAELLPAIIELFEMLA